VSAHSCARLLDIRRRFRRPNADHHNGPNVIIAFLCALVATDTVRIIPMERPPLFDGRADTAEYGAPSLTIDRPGRPVLVWLRSYGGQVYLAARITDPTWYWGDDLVVSLDTRGDRATGPEHDDFQWYFRRALDSSVVFRGDAGKWRAPRDDPDWRLGREREGGGWEVRSVDGQDGWSLELRLDASYFREAGAGRPGLALRVYDDDPHGWHTWPTPAGVRQPTEVERRPELWSVVLGP